MKQNPFICSKYLERLIIDSALYDYSIANNTINAYLYTVDEFGLPEFLVDTSATVINPSSINYPRFVNFNFNYFSMDLFNLNILNSRFSYQLVVQIITHNFCE